ncbi:MAG: hypothetical protein ACKV2T_20205 [Kofleriaceae bacterium]
MVVRFDPAHVREFMKRDWGLLRVLKRQYWRERLDRGGLAEALRVTEQMRQLCLSLNPAWPSEQERNDDLETHQRVAKALLKTRKAQGDSNEEVSKTSRPQSERTRRVRAVRRQA